jgi:hypothetical protein
MSNQFPPTGNGQGDAQNPGQFQNPNQSGGYGAPEQSNSGYGASTGGYQGYQPQSGYQGYGSPDQNQQGQQSGYGSYDQGQQSSGGYGGYGQQSGGGYGGYGQQDQQVYGAANTGYGQPGQGQQPGQPYGGAYGGGYGEQPPQGGKKKGFPVWAWIVTGVVVLALIGGGIWGGIAIFGGGNDYNIESDKTVSDVDVDYKGDWEDYGQGSYMNDDMTCVYYAGFESGVTGIDPDDVEGSMQDAVEEAAGSSSGTSVTAEKLQNIDKADTEGVNVEFVLYEIAPESGEGVGYMALHPFSDSGEMLMMAGICQGSGDIDEDTFKDMMADTDFTLHPED